MSAKKSKAQLAVESRHAFALAVVEVLKIVGACCVEEPKPCPEAKGPDRSHAHLNVGGGEWRLDLDDNVLRISPYSRWIACRFEREPIGALRTAALLNGESLNPFSFKWNFHFTIEEPGAREARSFGLALCSLMPLERAALLVARLNGLDGSSSDAERDAERMRALLGRVGFDASVKAWHGVSVRSADGYFGLHTPAQVAEAVQRIEAGEAPLAVLKAVSG